jgi:uncharacterized protein (TIGR03000 family)
MPFGRTGTRRLRSFIAACGVALGLPGVLFAGPLQAGAVSPRPGQNSTAAAALRRVTSRISASVPQDDAELYVNGDPVSGAGTARAFRSPALEAGKSYEYRFTVKWRPNNYTVITRTKHVRFSGGDTVTVDLTTDDANDRAEIRYVPTPNDTVQQMIQLAQITKDDVVFEPGCGDARITIAAVKAGARRGVGIDLDPARVAESGSNVKAAGLERQIDIRLGDALDIKDLSDATVVFLYMGDEFDKLIRPILWKQLKVGTRIVSHRFTMGDWPPEKSVVISGGDDETYASVHLWTITQEVKDRAGRE